MSNFYQLFAAAAARFPDRTAIEVLRSGVETWTYSALEADAARWAAWLTSRGIAPGDRCAILADNDARWIGAYFGVLRVGAVAVPLDTNYKPQQIRTVADSCDARLIFTTAKYWDAVAEAAPARMRADLYDAEEPPPAAAAPAAVDRAPNDAAVILYTSGTTSDPKGVILSHGNLEAERAAAFKIITLSERDAVLGVLPLFHALAQLANLLLPLIVGGRVVFLETVSSTSLLEALQTRGITIFACVPQFFYLIHQKVMAEVGKRGRISRAIFGAMLAVNGWLRDKAGVNPGRRWFARVHHTLGVHMRVLVTGGSKFDPVIGRDLYALGFTLLNAYGLTECTGGATICRPADAWNTSVGAPFDGVEVKIRKDPSDPGGREYDDGEVLIRGPIVMQGYFNRPDATAAVLKDGWLHTGDLGYVDARGRLYITGRSKEIIVLSSGKNLYPEEIEAHYRQSAIIKELCVLGLTKPGQPSAERLHAVIVPDEQVMKERGITNVRELVRFDIEGLSVTLPAHKRVLTYDIWFDTLPRTTTGKVKRHEVERRVREYAATATAEAQAARPLTEADKQWLSDPERADALAAIQEKLKRPSISPDANLELDLTLDSMERVELLTMVEHRFETRVTPEVRAKIFTVKQLVDAVIAAETSGTGASATPWATVLAQDPGDSIVDNLREPHRIAGLASFVGLRIVGLIFRALGFRASGVENVPAKGPFLICPNHQSYFDAFFLLSQLPWRIYRQLFFVGASEYFETPLMSRMARAANIVPVDSNVNLVRALQAGAAGLRLGKVLVLFPEGERSIDGELKPFRKGAAVLASQLNVPIVPVAMTGLWQLWPRSRGLQWRALPPWRHAPVRLTFGAPIRVTPGNEAATAAELRAAVETMFAALRAERS